jgi:hypothetical protein
VLVEEGSEYTGSEQSDLMLRRKRGVRVSAPLTRLLSLCEKEASWHIRSEQRVLITRRRKSARLLAAPTSLLRTRVEEAG